MTEPSSTRTKMPLTSAAADSDINSILTASALDFSTWLSTADRNATIKVFWALKSDLENRHDVSAISHAREKFQALTSRKDLYIATTATSREGVLATQATGWQTVRDLVLGELVAGLPYHELNAILPGSTEGRELLMEAMRIATVTFPGGEPASSSS